MSSNHAPTIQSVYGGTCPVPFGKTNVTMVEWMSSTEACSGTFLEDTHDYIQWLFPTKKPSSFSVNAPVLTDDDVDWYATHPEAIVEILKHTSLMFGFWGMIVYFGVADGKLACVAYEQSPSRHKYALLNIAAHQHNILRMTRVITCLREIGLPEIALRLNVIINPLIREALASDNRMRFEKSLRVKLDDGTCKNITFANEWLAKEWKVASDAYFSGSSSAQASVCTYLVKRVDVMESLSIIYECDYFASQ